MISHGVVDAAQARALLGDSGGRGVLDRLVRLASLALRAPVATLGVADGERLVLASQLGVPEPWRSAGHLPLQATFCRLVLLTADALAVEDVGHHPLGSDVRLENFHRVSYCGAPINAGGEAVAVLSVCDTRPRRWTGEDMTLIRDLAAAVLRELELLMDRNVADSEQDELRVREARYRRLFEESRTPLFVMTPDSLLLETNHAFAELMGRRREDLTRTPLSLLAADGAAFQRLLDDFKQHGMVAETEFAFRHASGEERVCVVSGSAHGGDDGPLYHGVLRDVTVQKRAQEELTRTALQDPLTGLPNRLVFMDRLERALQRSRRRPAHGFAVLFLDLDNFKTVNDTMGHLVGDQLLVNAARRLESCVRQEDTVARIGGDEFAILLDMIQDVNGVTLVVDRIRETLAEPFTAAGREANCSASIGVAVAMNNYERAEDLLRDADTAMYRAKSGGRDRYVLFDGDMHDRYLAQRQLEQDLREAVAREQFDVHYQPEVRLDTGCVTGMEALVRWAHPDRGILLPAEFMPLAEQTGLIVEMGWWVLREACRQLKAWQEEYPDTAVRMTMSVNLSAKEFVHPALVTKLDEILADTQLDPSCLRLDLTEAVFMKNAELAAGLLRKLRQRGVHICIDDFGTGYTSLSRLREFPISTLKIDRSFVHRLESDGAGREVVQSIIALGRSMAIDAVAEGVETPEQLEQLRRLGTRFAQGFLFSLPLDRIAAGALLDEV
jgi:diguanylate cyclase (GGDEF)-like protein/PAS domain S-box-containing protein